MPLRQVATAFVLFQIILSTVTVTVTAQSAGNDPFTLEEQQQQQFYEQQQQQQYEPCTPCDGPIDQSLSFDGTNCNEWLTYASQVPANTEECALERLLGWKFCGCPAPGVRQKCQFCDVPGAVQRDKELPFSSITCDAFIDVPALDGDVTCQLADDFATYCGCPTATPQCTLCDDGAPPQFMDNPLYLDMKCSDIHDLYMVSSTQRCGDLAADYPFDLQSYCGCNNAIQPNNGCEFCPYQGTLYNTTQTLISDETSTCGDWARLAEHAKEGESSCAVFQYVGLECCDDMDLPDFFTDYFEEETGQPATQATNEPILDFVDNQGTQEVVNSSGNPNAVPLDSNIPATPQIDTSTSGAGSMQQAIQVCFQEHTTDLVAVNSQQLGAATSPRSPNNTATNYLQSSVERAAQDENLGELFHQRARVSRTPMNATTGSNYTIVAKDGGGQTTSTQTNKWTKLYQEMGVASLPQDVEAMIPGEFLSNTFLPGLASCLTAAMDRYTSCSLCEGGQTPLQADKMIPVVGLYCDEYSAWREDATLEDCQSFDSSWLPFNMASFCGCPGVPDMAIKIQPTATEQEATGADRCSFCPEGKVLVLESWKHGINDKTLLANGGYTVDSTCAEWSQMADYVTTAEACSFVQTIANSGCCEVMGQSMLDQTPPSPSILSTPAPPITASPITVPPITPPPESGSTSTSGAAKPLGATAVALVLSILSLFAW